MLYDIFRYGFGIFFVALHTALMFGSFLEWLRDRKRGQTDKAKVSVIIPIHNESTRMEGLLHSLLIQSYPAQIIFVDDRSADKSPVMLERFAKDAILRGFDCRILTLTENPGPNRKQFALSKGIAEANGDYLLFTDGDCEVPPDWIRAMVSRIQNEQIGAAIGPVFKKKQGKGFLYLFQCYDHALRYNYLVGATGLGAAGGGFGNNMIINRKALDKVGGYNSIPSSPTEDAALISQIRGKGGFRVRAITHPDAVIETEAEESWRTFFNQTLRWHNGGLFSPEFLTRFNYNLLSIIISAGIIVIPLLPFIPSLWPLSTAVLISMILNTITTFALFRKKLPRGGLLINLTYFLTLLYMPVHFTLLTIMGFARVRTTWKNNQTT
jgi:cellulose synthase/poly-beta-1,6-N-acetylglucosamine synthase-like glycosyltransferase